MALWARPGQESREVAWTGFAAEFELDPMPELAEILRDQFALDDGELDPVYALQRTDQPQLVAFDQWRERRGPTGSVAKLRTLVAVRSQVDRASLSLRVSSRRNKALESIEASRSGAQRLELPNHPDFDEHVSVYTREPQEARLLLTPAVRVVLARLMRTADDATEAAQPRGGRGGLLAPSVAPSVVVGTRNLLLTLEPREPLPFEPLADLLIDMLSLYAALSSVNHVQESGSARSG